MKYTVVWKPAAERRLAECWNQSSERQRLADAADRIDYLLKHSPDMVGGSRDQNRRILLEPPLGVIYKVVEEDCMVFVLSVWELPRVRDGQSRGATARFRSVQEPSR